MGPFPSSLRKHHRGADHLRTCTDCRAAVERERQYLERLRCAEVPAASTDFTARLLERTQLLAAEPERANTGNGLAVRVVAVSASGALVAAGVLTATALLLAGEPAPRAEGPTSVTSPTLLSLIPNGVTASTRPDSSSGGQSNDSGGGASTAPKELTTAELAALRNAGWVCPELASMGYRLVSAKAVSRQGAPAVELRFTAGSHGATVVEQHAATPDPAAGNTEVAGPVNVQTGRPAAEDGFAPAPGLLPGFPAPQADGTAAWVRGSEPIGVIYRSGNATLSYFADVERAPGQSADPAVALQELAQAAAAAERGISAGAPQEPGLTEARGERPNEPLADRLGRGLRIMLGLQPQ